MELNITDIATGEIEIPDRHLMLEILDQQSHLMVKYHPIEQSNGIILPAHPWFIDDIAVQLRVKDMFWRATEEMAEAMQVVPDITWEDRPPLHFFEELADALHFLAEGSIIGSMPNLSLMLVWDKVFKCLPRAEILDPVSLRVQAMYFITWLGLAANTLKNKPWKQTQMPTDQAMFHQALAQAWFKFLVLLRDMQLKPIEIYVLYMKKHRVNQFRQRSRY